LRLQVANEKAEADRKPREEEKKAEKKEIMELRQATAALRKEKEAYESMYGHSDVATVSDVLWRGASKQVRSSLLRYVLGRCPKPNKRTPGAHKKKLCRHHGSSVVYGT